MNNIYQTPKSNLRRPARVIIWGLGALGSRLLKGLPPKGQYIDVVGAVDYDPKFTGKTISEAFPEYPDLNVQIMPTLKECINSLDKPADVVYHMTESDPYKVMSQLEMALSYKLNVISAAESIFYPRLRHAEIADRLDKVARQNNVTIAGVGINPGFTSDLIILALARVSTNIKRIEMHRVVDCTGTGPLDIAHVGFGLWPDEFRAKLQEGNITGHLGAPESVTLLAEHLNLPIDRIEQTWDLATSPYEVDSTIGMLEPGRVIGITQSCTGYIGDRDVIKHSLVMYFEAKRHGIEEVDEYWIEGSNNLHVINTPCFVTLFGAALNIINSTHDVMNAEPGLQNILNFRLGGPYRGNFELAIDKDKPATYNRIWLVSKELSSD